MLVVLIAIPLLWSDRLPDPVARQWGLDGAPNASSPLWVLLLITGGILALTWISLIFAHRQSSATSSSVAVVYFIGALLVSLQVITVWANLDAASWQGAQHMNLIQVAVVIGVAVVWGAVGWFLYGTGTAILHPSPGTPQATAHLDARQTVVWVSRAQSRWMPFLAIGLLITGLLIGGAAPLLLGAIAVIVFTFSAAQMRVSDQGVDIGLGWWGWPSKTYQLDELSAAEAIDVDPLSFGGWGLRVISGHALTRTWALTIRRGPAIRLVRKNGPDIVVTIDEPDTGAGLINDLLSESRRIDADQPIQPSEPEMNPEYIDPESDS